MEEIDFLGLVGGLVLFETSNLKLLGFEKVKCEKSHKQEENLEDVLFLKAIKGIGK